MSAAALPLGRKTGMVAACQLSSWLQRAQLGLRVSRQETQAVGMATSREADLGCTRCCHQLPWLLSTSGLSIPGHLHMSTLNLWPCLSPRLSIPGRPCDWPSHGHIRACMPGKSWVPSQCPLSTFRNLHNSRLSEGRVSSGTFGHVP